MKGVLCSDRTVSPVLCKEGSGSFQARQRLQEGGQVWAWPCQNGGLHLHVSLVPELGTPEICRKLGTMPAPVRLPTRERNGQRKTSCPHAI